MHISKMVLKLALMASATSIATTAYASSCNMRDGKGRYAASNPEKKSFSSHKVSKSTVTPAKTRQGRK